MEAKKFLVQITFIKRHYVTYGAYHFFLFFIFFFLTYILPLEVILLEYCGYLNMNNSPIYDLNYNSPYYSGLIFLLLDQINLN